MEIEDIGQVYHFLLKYRMVETKPTRRRQDDEVDVAAILRSATVDQLQTFSDFLKPQGMCLVEFSDDMRGVAAGGRTWVLARNPESAPPQYFTTEPVVTAMRLRNTESRESAMVWFLHIWLIYLTLIYTRSGRGISEVSGYIDATFSQEKLIQTVEEHIEQIRQQGTMEHAESRVIKILDAEKGKDISRRIGSFLRLMRDARLVIEVADREYQQTLLGAHELAHGYERSLRIPIDNVLNTIVNIVAPADEVDKEKELSDGSD